MQYYLIIWYEALEVDLFPRMQNSHPDLGGSKKPLLLEGRFLIRQKKPPYTQYYAAISVDRKLDRDKGSNSSES